jgi:histidyl-tRNA synthetase
MSPEDEKSKIQNSKSKIDYRAPRGTEDVLPDEMRLIHKLHDTARRLFELYGYGEIRLPTFEQTALFIRSIGESTDIVEKEMFTF